MNRRDFFFAGLAVPLLARSAFAADPIHVVYIGGWDCPYCTIWKNEYKGAWIASPMFMKVRWTEIDPPHLREAYQERYWPGDLKPILDQLPHKSGTPRFLVVEGGRVVFNELGVNKWEDSLSLLRQALG
jgi:hypothetical protein